MLERACTLLSSGYVLGPQMSAGGGQGLNSSRGLMPAGAQYSTNIWKADSSQQEDPFQ